MRKNLSANPNAIKYIPSSPDVKTSNKKTYIISPVRSRYFTKYKSNYFQSMAFQQHSTLKIANPLWKFIIVLDLDSPKMG